jgi:hypothetical protein
MIDISNPNLSPEVEAALLDAATNAESKLATANKALIEATKALEDYNNFCRSLSLSAENVEAKQTSAEFTGSDPAPHGTRGRLSPYLH